jgi:hypothetical protein
MIIQKNKLQLSRVLMALKISCIKIIMINEMQIKNYHLRKMKKMILQMMISLTKIKRN